MKLNENGRSMVEMLGVLGIIGVITVGGFTLVGQSLSMQRNARIISDAAALAASAKKIACQYDSGYNSYTYYLHASEAHPGNLTYNSTKGVFEGVDDATYSVTYDRASGEVVHDYFKIVLSNIDEDTCIRSTSAEWGTPQSSGFLGMSIGTNDEKEFIIKGNTSVKKQNAAIVGSSWYPISVSDAAKSCNGGNNNTVNLWYKGCR